jgi:hypothetical protein
VEHNKKRKENKRFYFFLAIGLALAFGFALGLAFGFAFEAALTGFIGAPQHISSTGSQPQGSSITTISPHSSHLYFSPFFAKNQHVLKTLTYTLQAFDINVSKKKERMFI